MSFDSLADDEPTEAGFALGEAVVGGRFRLGERLSWGGMGTVYRAVDLDTGREVAVKLPHIGAPGATESRFDREIEAVATLVCSSVIGYVGHGSHDEPYLAMELVNGDPLFKRLQLGPFTETAALHVARRVASALAAIHLGGWVHRDVKPGNIVIGFEGAIKLLDFGLSRTIGQADGTTTAKGDLIGTLGYMAPEQLSGQPIVDARTDVFSLGVVLFECLTGRRAYNRTMAELAKKIPEPPLDVRGAPIRDELASLIESMVSHLPSKRPIDGVDALAKLLWLDAPNLAPGKLGAVRAALRHVLRTGAVAMTGPYAGSSTSSAASVAALLAEVIAPSDVVVLACDPSFTSIPLSHASVLARRLADRGHTSLARRLDKSRRHRFDANGEEPQRRVIVVLEDAPWCDPLSAAAIQELVLDRSISLVVATFTEIHEPTLMPTWPTVGIDTVMSIDVTFERLSPLARWVLRASAMFGRDIPTDGVVDLVAGHEAHDVAHVLEHLSARRIVNARRSQKSFSFASSVLLEAARRLASPGEMRLGTALAHEFRSRNEPDAAPCGVWAIASEEALAALAHPNEASR